MRSQSIRPRFPLFLLLALLSSCAPNRGAGYERAMGEARDAYHAGRFDAAAERFDAAAKSAKIPRDAAFARYEAALARARAGDVARARAELRAIADAKPPNDYSAEAAFKAAELVAKADPAAGAAELEAMALRFPSAGVARVALARVLRWIEEEKAPGGAASDGAKASLARLDELLPRVTGTPLEEEARYQRAKRLAIVGRREEARDAFVAVADQYPYPSGAYFDDSLYRASEIEEELGRPREAIALLERLLSFRESSATIGSYERPRYVPAVLRIATIYEDKLHDRKMARETLHRLYSDFKTSTMRDDALWREADLFRKDGDNDSACGRLGTLTRDFPDSRYVPCAIERCPAIQRPSKSKAPKECHPYLTREHADEATEPSP